MQLNPMTSECFGNVASRFFSQSSYLHFTTGFLSFIQRQSNILIQSSAVHSCQVGLEAEMDEIERYKAAQCIRITLEGGADVSLEGNMGDDL